MAGLVDAVATGARLMTATRFRTPNVVIMHPRRFYETFGTAVDLQGRPLQLPSTNPTRRQAHPDDACVGEWLGMRVILDVNVPTTSGSGSQDYVILGHTPDWLLYEGLPNFLSHLTADERFYLRHRTRRADIPQRSTVWVCFPWGAR